MPGMNPPPPPDTPYPFDKPPSLDRPLVNQLPPERPIRPFLNGVPLPEQIVPSGNRPWSWNRPGIFFFRSTLFKFRRDPYEK